MKLPYNFIIKRVEDESGVYFHAAVLEFDGCQSTGSTFEEAFSCLKEAMEGWIETKLGNGFPVPAPLDTDKFSGKFVVRLPKTLHARLAIEAEKEGVSLNQYAMYKLSVPSASYNPQSL
jgi:predicted RNase H-like HicB family nuclease